MFNVCVSKFDIALISKVKAVTFHALMIPSLPPVKSMLSIRFMVTTLTTWIVSLFQIQCVNSYHVNDIFLTIGMTLVLIIVKYDDKLFLFGFLLGRIVRRCIHLYYKSNNLNMSCLRLSVPRRTSLALRPQQLARCLSRMVLSPN